MEEKALGDLIDVYKYLNGGCKEGRARFGSVVPSIRTRGHGHKPAHRRFPENIQQHSVLSHPHSTGTGIREVWGLLLGGLPKPLGHLL